MTSADTAVALRLDPDRRRPMNPIWSFGGNTCHAPLWLRDDLCRHLERVRDDLGFSYIRAHGPLGDGNGVVRADGSFDFSRLLEGLDRLLERKLTPFLELSHMPDALARGDKSLAKYRFRSDPPADWNRWYQLIEALMDQLLKRYGIQQLRTWYFEVWNEPDISFWTGTQEEYFKLYDLAARAVKQCDRQLRIGGPATARTNWIDEFLEHVNKPSADFGLDGPRCDFVSTHAYPSDLEFLDAAEGEVELQNSNVMRQLFTAVRRKVDKALGEGFPVICGEWNSSAGPLAANHDDCNNGAFIAKTMVELSELCQGSLVWNISDIYEECGFHYEPFHGGYGLLTVNDLPKAAFHAFALLHEHDQAERLEVQLNNAPEGVGALASCDDQQVRLLLYYYCEPGNESPTAVNVQLQGLPESRAQRVGVAPGQGSAYETWVELGRPSYVNRHVLDRLEAASQPKRDTIDTSGPIRLEPGTMMQLTWPV